MEGRTENRDGHDPWFDLEGVGARRLRRRTTRVARLAFGLAVCADIVVIAEWAIRLGLASGVPFGR